MRILHFRVRHLLGCVFLQFRHLLGCVFFSSGSAPRTIVLTDVIEVSYYQVAAHLGRVSKPDIGATAGPLDPASTDIHSSSHRFLERSAAEAAACKSAAL